MSEIPKPGDHVRHEVLGVGKVLTGDGDVLSIYFKQFHEGNPDKRVRRFKAPWPHLVVIESQLDAELDNLPPWKDGHFMRAKNAIGLDSAIKKFLDFFPRGLADEQFLERECAYKRAAHERFFSSFKPEAKKWISDNADESIASALDNVYGDSKADKDGPVARLNLLYQRVEEPAFFDALRAGGQHTVNFAEAAVDFIEITTQQSFDKYLRALEQLPARKGGASIDLWTTFTWLPFIAAPDRHFFIKPTIVQAFASALPFYIQYESSINFQTYVRSVSMAKRLRDILEGSELNPQGRVLDLIDVQSFMWVVERWSASDVKY